MIAMMICTVQPMPGVFWMEPGMTTHMNQTMAQVTVNHRNQAGMIATMANLECIFLDTKAAPVISAIEAMSWFAALKEGQRMLNWPVQAR